MGAPTLCSRCSGNVLRVRPERCSLSDGKPCSPCTEDMELEKEEKKLEMMIEKIQIKRRALRTRMNDNHDRLIHKFPPEIASHVFIQYTPSIDYISAKINPLYLGAVCQKWRQLAWGTPELWTSLCIGPFRKHNDDLLSLLTGWLERSASLPLTIKVVHGSEWGYPREDVLDILNKHSARWHNLHLDFPAHLLHRLSGSSQKNILRRLVLRHPVSGAEDQARDPSSFSTFSMKSWPRLTDLALIRVGLPSVDILWDNLAVASIGNIGVDHCFELIRRAPNLETLSLRAIKSSSTVFPAPNARIVHRRLHSLELLGVREETVAMEILNSLCLPSLESLTHKQSAFPVDSLISFAGCLSSCFKAFKIGIDEVGYHQLSQFLSHLTSLKYLELRGVNRSNYYYSELVGWLSASARSSFYLPHLQSLQFTCKYFPCESLAEIFAQPRWKFVRVKLNTQIDTLQDDLKTAELLLGLVDKGFRLSIVRDGKEDLLQKYRKMSFP
ncbi:hypothetical protein M413DRAFT_247964 [Hebeloma cylindrosporum]|uniref:Uncharacterized protein n=1 Tax=Hebeloma cylindrosporum TaxID=76867 RepID=A0A0C2YB31_HEBCY|nr:hypothetical protein M413DRAFT_247964 [Hebeloma cylindrosporum h7]